MKEILIAAAAMSLMLGAGQAGQQPQQQTTSQQATPQQTTPQQTSTLPAAPQPQAIPDAPKPQVTGIEGVAPGKATTLNDNGSGSSSSPSNPDDSFQAPVGATLPQTQSAPAAVDQDPDNTPPEGGQVFTYRTGVNFVEVPFTVKDNKGHLVPGLSYRDIHIYENNVRQHMVAFTVEPFPLSVAVVIDQSLPIDVMKRVNNALDELPNVFAAYDEVAVFTYNNGPKLVTDFTAGTSARLAAVIDRSKTEGREQTYYVPGEGLGSGINLNGGAQHDMTPLDGSHTVGSPIGVAQVPREAHTLNDAILAAAKQVSKAGRGRRRIVYVISDGKEYGSVANRKEVIKYLQTNKVQVYATVVGDSSISGLGFVSHLHLPLMMKDNALTAYTSATGGEAYADYRTKSIAESFGKITSEERTQYTVGYNTKESLLDAKYRKIEVRVLKPNLEVIAKDGYWPSAVDAAPPQRPSESIPKPTMPPPPQR